LFEKSLLLPTRQSRQESEKGRVYEKPWPLQYYSNPWRKVKNNGRMKKLCPYERPNPGRRAKGKGHMKNLGHYGTTPILVGKRRIRGV
jgi:hypothetical protein